MCFHLDHRETQHDDVSPIFLISKLQFLPCGKRPESCATGCLKNAMEIQHAVVHHKLTVANNSIFT
jgi:hypothetical protein